MTTLPAVASPEHCAIEGIVVDAEFTPIAEAEVGVLNTSLQAHTDLAGRFTFHHVEATGTVQVAAARLGYFTGVRTVPCPDGDTTHVQIVLERIPDEVPFTVTYLLSGRISCAAAYYTIATADTCQTFGLGAGRSAFELAPPAGDVTAADYHFDWVRNGPGAECLAMSVTPWKNAATVTTDDEVRFPGLLKGRSPVDVRVDAVDPAGPLYAFGANARFPVVVRSVGSSSPSPMECNSTVVLEQDFEAVVRLAYGGASL